MKTTRDAADSAFFRYLPYAVLLTEVLLFYRKALFTATHLMPWDLPSYNLPQATYISISLRSGTFPIWDPYTYCGFPFFANIPNQLFYPPTLLTIALSGLATGRPLLRALEWQIAAHVFLAGVGAYWLSRRLGIGRGPATLAATVFQLGPYFASMSALGPSNAGAWLPFACLCVVALRETFRWRWVALLAACFAMAILAGFPAVTAIVLVGTLLLAIGFVLIERRSVKLVAAVLVAGAWSVLLAAVQVLPTLQLIGQSSASGRGSWTLAGSPLVSLVTLLAPNHFGELDMSSTYHLSTNQAFVYLYCGVPGLLLALATVAFIRTRLVAVFTGFTVASLLWMLGSSTPVGSAIWAILPGSVKAPLYVEFTKVSMVLGVAVLAGLGADRLQRWRYAVAMLVVVTAADLILVGSGRKLNTGLFAEYAITTPQEFEGAKETIPEVRKLVDQTVPPSRIEAVEDSGNWLTIGLVAQIPTAHGDEALALSRVLAVRRIFCEGPEWLRHCQASKLDSPVFDFLNIRYIVSWQPGGPEAVRKAGLQRVLDVAAHQVYENPKVLPRFFLTSHVQITRDFQESLAAMASPQFDPRRTAVVEGLTGWTDAGAETPADAVKVRSYGQRNVELEVNSPADAFLVTSETYYPGWGAYVDGRERKLWITNGAFRGLPVPAGRHTIEMRFQPQILWLSLMLSAAAWCALLFTVVQGVFDKRLE
jgi:hypothetical protein